MDILNLPGEDTLSSPIFYKTLSTKFKVINKVAVLPGNNLEPVHIYTDNTTLPNYAVYSSESKSQRPLKFYPFSLNNKPNIKHIGILTKNPALIVTGITNKEYWKIIKQMFLDSMNEIPEIVSDSRLGPYCYIQWYYPKIDYSKQLSFLTKLLERLYEDIFNFK